MRRQLAVALVLLCVVLDASAAGEVDADALAVAVGGETAAGAVLDDEHKVVVVSLGEAAPDWAGMRDRVKAAQATLDADGSLPGWGVALMWSTDRIALSEVVDGRARTTVGNGSTMLQDKSEFALAASPVAVQRNGFLDWGSGYSAGEKITCKGTATNLGAEPAEVTVRCTIYGVVTKTVYGTGGISSQEQQVVLATKDHSLGPLKPGKKTKFSFKLKLIDVDKDASLSSFCTLNCAVMSMSFDQRYLVDGAEVEYFDTARDAEGTAWLALLAALEKEGLRLRPGDNKSWVPNGFTRSFIVSEPFASLEGKKRVKAAKKVYKKVRAHAKKYGKFDWFGVYFFDDADVQTDRVVDGEYGND